MTNQSNAPRPIRPDVAACLSERGLHAVAGSWDARTVRLALRLSELPYTSTERRWSFVFAIDRLRDRPDAIEALLQIVDKFDARPTFSELMAAADRLLAVQRDIDNLLRGRANPLRQAKPPPVKAKSSRVEPPAHIAVVKWCLSQDDKLGDRDRAFLESLARYATTSEKQRKWLCDICRRCGFHWDDPQVIPLPQDIPELPETPQVKPRSAPTASGMTRAL